MIRARSRTARSELSGEVLHTYARRAALLAHALDRPLPVADLDSREKLSRAVDEIVDVGDRSQVWLALAVLSGRLPLPTTVTETARTAEFRSGALFDAIVDQTTPASARWDVVLESARVTLDVAHTASTTLMTGIQRVVRETARRWLATHDAVATSWTEELDAMRFLTPVEHDRLLKAAAADEDGRAPRNPSVIIPWRTTIVVPELATNFERTGRLQALAQYSQCTMSSVAYDLIPITSGETTSPGMSDEFARNLAAIRFADRVAPISAAAAVEYEGWRMMLAATGVPGPTIEAVNLPVEAADSSPAELDEARLRFTVGTLPLVLVVGSHEPRKNHLAVLHAAELLWRDGLRFGLTFVGGNSWNSQGFDQRLHELQSAGRPVEAASKVTDAELWAAYRLSRFTVFPSLNEGFGLPVAESLAVGTPAITSDFGSMAEIASEGGAIMIDPHDDRAISRAMRTLLENDEAHQALVSAALARPVRTWDDYASELWDFLVEGNRPGDREGSNGR